MPKALPSLQTMINDLQQALRRIGLVFSFDPKKSACIRIGSRMHGVVRCEGGVLAEGARGQIAILNNIVTFDIDWEDEAMRRCDRFYQSIAEAKKQLLCKHVSIRTRIRLLRDTGIAAMLWGIESLAPHNAMFTRLS